MPLADWKIEPLTVSDIDQVLAIDQKVFPSDSWSEESFRSSINDGQCYALKDNGSVLGVIVFSTVLDEGELLHIAVHHEYLKKGIASFMMEFMFDKGKQAGVSDWYLEVRQSNTPAINLYKKFGFDITGKRKDYYKTANGREDALLMRKHCAL